MKILSIDTASNICTVAILEDTNCIEEIIVNDAKNHSEKIMPIIDEALNRTDLTLKDIDLVVCDKGPGSFTGIRIGVATALGFEDSLNIKTIGISSLEALAYNVQNEGLICSLIDAKNDNVYFGLFTMQNNEYSQIEEYCFDNISNIINTLINYNVPITFVGDGALKHKEYISSNYSNSIFCERNELSSISLGLAGFNAFNKKIDTSIMPLYLRKSQAERELEKKGEQNNGNI